MNFGALVLWWQKSNKRKLLNETWQATSMVLKFMALAFFINALVNFYVPQDFLADILNGNGSASVVIAILAGIPAYTTNITALPLINAYRAVIQPAKLNRVSNPVSHRWKYLISLYL